MILSNYLFVYKLKRIIFAVLLKKRNVAKY